MLINEKELKTGLKIKERFKKSFQVMVLMVSIVIKIKLHIFCFLEMCV